MGNDWKLVRLGDYVDSCLGKMLDKNKNKGTFHPYLGNKNVRWGRFDLQNLSQMKFQEDEHHRYGLLFGDLIVCEGGEPGRCAIWKNEVSEMKIQKALHRVRPFNELNNIYLYYWFVFSVKNGLLDPFFTGTTIKHLTGKALADLQLPLPPFSEQKRIAHILGSLDDKIELNRQMNATLEGMAQALFKSWFVDFDPVIDNALAVENPIPEVFAARAETRRKALAHGTANRDVAKQFPAAFQFTEDMGWIPEGWEVESIYDLISIIYGAPFKSSLFNSDGKGVSVIRIRDLKTGVPQNWTTEDHPKKTLIKTGDVLVGMDAEFRATIWPGESGYLNQRLFLARPKEYYVNNFFIQYTLKPQLEFEENTQVGTTVSHLGKKEIDKFLLLNPMKELLLEYSKKTTPLLYRLVSNNNDLKTLTNLRDTLLPKLISGEIRIPEAEKLTEEALA